MSQPRWRTSEFLGIRAHQLLLDGTEFADRYFEDSDLDDDWDMGPVEKLGVHEFWYWYGQGSYDGAGSCVMRRGNEYDLKGLDHCSCYGPTDGITFAPGRSFDDLLRDDHTGDPIVKLILNRIREGLAKTDGGR